MSLSPSKLLDLLADHRLLDSNQAQDIRSDVRRFADAPTFAAHLESLGWLTRFQIDRILAGQIESLFLDDYRLVEFLGAGGMGQVFKAVHVRLKRPAAIKMIHPKFLQTADDPAELLRRFEREAQVAAQLMHTNIVTLFDYNVVNEVPFIAMEYVDGFDLAKMVRRKGPMSAPRASEYIRQAAVGLQHAFELGMVHRDIKPHNLLVAQAPSARKRSETGQQRVSGLVVRPAAEVATPRPTSNGTIKILDLGLVRLSEPLNAMESMTTLTGEGTLIGTPDYIAPEQARDASRVDIRADLYSLGCTYYHLLTGRPPFPNGNSVEKLLQHQIEPPEPVESLRPGTPREISKVVRRLIEKKPEDRFQTPMELVRELSEISLQLWSGQPTGMTSACDEDAASIATMSRVNSITEPEIDLSAGDDVVVSAKKHAVLEGRHGHVTALCFSPCGRWLASGDIAGAVRLWNVCDGRPTERALEKNESLGEISQLSFCQDGRVLIATTTGSATHIWRWEIADSHVSKRTEVSSSGYLVSCHAVSPDGSQMAAGSGAAVLVYRPAMHSKPMVLRGHQGEVRSVAFAQRGHYVYSTGDDGAIVFWEPDRFWQKLRKRLSGHESPVVNISVSSEGQWLVTAGLDGSIRLWNASGDSETAVATLTGHESGVRCVRFVGKDRFLLSYCDGGTVSLWNVEERSRVRQWRCQRGLNQTVAICPKGNYIATGANSGQVTVYDLELSIEDGVTA